MNNADMTYPLPQKNEAVLSFLENRRSNLAKVMEGPGPTDQDLDRILNIAARVPDHRKLAPWRFILFKGDARSRMGQHIGAAFQSKNPDMPLDRVLFEAGRLQRAPLVVAVISSPKECPRGTPKWEQELSAAAVCFNMCLAAQASGFGAQWLTEWYAYDSGVNTALGLAPQERVAGYIYIGHLSEPASERARPDAAKLTQIWE